MRCSTHVSTYLGDMHSPFPATRRNPTRANTHYYRATTMLTAQKGPVSILGGMRLTNPNKAKSVLTLTSMKTINPKRNDVKKKKVTQQ